MTGGSFTPTHSHKTGREHASSWVMGIWHGYITYFVDLLYHGLPFEYEKSNGPLYN